MSLPLPLSVRAQLGLAKAVVANDILIRDDFNDAVSYQEALTWAKRLLSSGLRPPSFEPVESFGGHAVLANPSCWGYKVSPNPLHDGVSLEYFVAEPEHKREVEAYYQKRGFGTTLKPHALGGELKGWVVRVVR
jgi:hypothetical protein